MRFDLAPQGAPRAPRPFSSRRSAPAALRFGASVACSACAVSLATGCSSTPAASNGPSSCTSPGEATSGPADDHCALPDGGLAVQTVSSASCAVGLLADAGDGDAADDGGGGESCGYGPTMYGHQAPDDDCKYLVTWSSSSICEGDGGVDFTVTATYLGTNEPLTGAQTHIEYYVPETTDGGCDTLTVHPGPTITPGDGLFLMKETTPGTYTGRIVFDQSGPWTLRFHFNENCDDVLPDSPHGHAAFRLMLP